MALVISRMITTCVIVAGALPCCLSADDASNLRLALRDQRTGELVPGRITLEQRPVGAASAYHFVKSLDPAGTAVTYDVARSPTSFEKHTTVSAHPFGASVPPGLYVIHYEHGPEWRGNKAQVRVEEGVVTEQELPISRWINMAERGWYSGDTHVHRSLEELPNVMLAEDVNVALPLSYWVRDAYTPPAQGDKSVTSAVEPQLIEVDPTHVIWPVNTEYELFTVNGRRHTLGAVFVLNHQQPLTLAAPPVAPIADEARSQGALLDLDKHSWPWSLMLVPVMDVDLFELSNNHIWRTEFYFKQWTQEMRPQGWNIETDSNGFTEWGWIDFGFKTYYALLNCGFRMRPTAGTASGVHPVPLGFGRVYVECPDGFSFENWMKGLNAGRSFVTTGPMLFVEVDGQPPGSTLTPTGPGTVRVQGLVEGRAPLRRIEIVRNGRVVDVVPASNDYESPNIFRTPFDVSVPIETSSWIAVRCFEGNPAEEKSFRFAHSAPVQIEVPGRPLHPRQIETDYLIRRMEEEIARNRDVLTADELAEYERARDVYSRIAQTALTGYETTNEQLQSLVLASGELPDGWGFTDIGQTEMQALGANPAIVSRPDHLGGFFGADRREQIDRCNVLRSLLTFYRHGQSDWFAVLSAHVCADEESARFAAELLKSPETMHGRFETWQHNDLVVWLSASEDLPDVELETFQRRIESRMQSLPVDQ